MRKAQKGDRVSFHFTARLDDGTVIDSTYDPAECEEDTEPSGPMELNIGEGLFFTKVEQALIGMSEQEIKEVTIPQEDAFGPYDPEQVFIVYRDQIPADFEAEEGDLLELGAEDNEEMEVVKVLAINGDEITLDGNHPYAGQRLHCEIKLEKILG
nr:FKBP-type peptidyl-prolyl cis-trans isomerase [uncultured Desulfuromonas sp.]